MKLLPQKMPAAWNTSSAKESFEAIKNHIESHSRPIKTSVKNFIFCSPQMFLVYCHCIFPCPIINFTLPAQEIPLLSPSGDQTTSRFAFPDCIHQAPHSVHSSTIDMNPLHTLHSGSKNRDLSRSDVSHKKHRISSCHIRKQLLQTQLADIIRCMLLISLFQKAVCRIYKSWRIDAHSSIRRGSHIPGCIVVPIVDQIFFCNRGFSIGYPFCFKTMVSATLSHPVGSSGFWDHFHFDLCLLGQLSSFSSIFFSAISVCVCFWITSCLADASCASSFSCAFSHIRS